MGTLLGSGLLGPLLQLHGLAAATAAVMLAADIVLLAAGLVSALAGAVSRNPRLRAAGLAFAVLGAAAAGVALLMAFSAAVGAAVLACAAAAGWVWLTRSVPATR